MIHSDMNLHNNVGEKYLQDLLFPQAKTIPLETEHKPPKLPFKQINLSERGTFHASNMDGAQEIEETRDAFCYL